MKDIVHGHGPGIKSLVEDFGDKWTIDARLTSQAVSELCNNKGVDVNSDQALHMIIAAFREGEAKVLAETAEVMSDDGNGTTKSRLELWSFLKHSYHRASAFRIVSVVEALWQTHPAKGMQGILPKIASLDQGHQQHHKQEMPPKDEEFTARRHRIQVHPEVVKHGAPLSRLPDGIVKL